MNKFTRRNFTKSAALGAAAFVTKLTPASNITTEHSSKSLIEQAEQHHKDSMNQYGHLANGKALKIGMVVYPGMFLLDLVGPLAVFEALMNREIHLIWKNLELVNEVKTNYSVHMPVRPTTTFADCPDDLDLLFIPGGVPGTLVMMEDAELIHFLSSKGSKSRYISSVCTGSLILGAAGLLKGYKATSHWITLDSLADFGSIPVSDRVVIDRNRITGGGVTAGIDFALEVVARLRSPEYAQAIQLYLEYNPNPPFNAGSPETAPIAVRSFIEDMFAGLKVSIQKIAQKHKL